MRNRFGLIVLGIAAAATLFACGSNSTPKKPDAAIDAFSTTCGKPGDTGNEQGIGKYCAQFSDCPSTAPLCSVIGDPTTHFCTKTCTTQGSTTECGTAVTCECNSSNQCGCTPNTCLGP
jgi:hypothetical protein